MPLLSLSQLESVCAGSAGTESRDVVWVRGQGEVEDECPWCVGQGRRRRRRRTDLMGNQTQGRGGFIHAVVTAAGHCIAPATGRERERERGSQAKKDRRKA